MRSQEWKVNGVGAVIGCLKSAKCLVCITVFNRRGGYYPPVIDLRTAVTVDDKKRLNRIFLRAFIANIICKSELEYQTGNSTKCNIKNWVLLELHNKEENYGKHRKLYPFD